MKKGYYWVKRLHDWLPAHYNGFNTWLIIGVSHPYESHEFTKIGKRITKPRGK